MWSSRTLLSLHATHVPGMNRGADLLSIGNPLYGEWRLHLQVTLRVWQRFGRAAVDLFALMSPVLLSITVRVPSVEPDRPDTKEGPAMQTCNDSVRAILAGENVGCGDCATAL